MLTSHSALVREQGRRSTLYLSAYKSSWKTNFCYELFSLLPWSWVLAARAGWFPSFMSFPVLFHYFCSLMFCLFLIDVFWACYVSLFCVSFFVFPILAWCFWFGLSIFLSCLHAHSVQAPWLCSFLVCLYDVWCI